MKNTTLRQLTVFETVARHLHFTRAAEALGTTQPSVSMQIKQLEDNLGVALFEHIGKRIHLTQAGREMLEHCQKITRQLAAAEATLDRLKGVRGGQLRLAIAPTAKYFVPRLLAEFMRLYPGVTVNLSIATRAAKLAQIENHECDMAIMTSPPSDPALTTTAFFIEPLVASAAPGHALAGGRAVPLARLAVESFLLREPASETRRMIEHFFTEKGLSIAAGVTANSNEAIKQGVQAGLGVAIVPRQSILPEQESGRLVVLDVTPLPLQTVWHVVHRRGQSFSGVAEAFRDFVLREVRPHAAGTNDAYSHAPEQRAGG